ncbi:MAG: ion channel [Porticoccus sp.]
MSSLTTVFIFNCAVISIAVLVHYEAMYRLAMLLPSLRVAPRFRVLVGVAGAFLAHVVEVWIFAVGYYLMLEWDTESKLGGNFDGSLLDCSYYSFTNYTSLGVGDIEPFGHIRFLTGLEGLTGLILIAWTASFMYIEMQKFWVADRKKL